MLWSGPSLMLYHTSNTTLPRWAESRPPLPPWGWMRPPLASHINQQCRHVPILMRANNNKHFNTSLLLRFCMLCLTSHGKWDCIKLSRSSWVGTSNKSEHSRKRGSSRKWLWAPWRDCGNFLDIWSEMAFSHLSRLALCRPAKTGPFMVSLKYEI